jgi:uncharacterized protein (TIGR03118 family)
VPPRLFPRAGLAPVRRHARDRERVRSGCRVRRGRGATVAARDVVAPNSFGRFAGDLLVGNFGDGRIHAFNLNTGRFDGTLSDEHHRAIQIDGLWALLVGDAVAGGADSIWFSAGPDDESHGLLGLLRAS